MNALQTNIHSPWRFTLIFSVSSRMLYWLQKHFLLHVKNTLRLLLFVVQILLFWKTPWTTHEQLFVLMNETRPRWYRATLTSASERATKKQQINNPLRNWSKLCLKHMKLVLLLRSLYSVPWRLYSIQGSLISSCQPSVHLKIIWTLSLYFSFSLSLSRRLYYNII